MDDVPDLLIHDEETVRELRLVAELIVVAATAPDTLDQDVIDIALRIERAPRSLPAQPGPSREEAVLSLDWPEPSTRPEEDPDGTAGPDHRPA